MVEFLEQFVEVWCFHCSPDRYVDHFSILFQFLLIHLYPCTCLVSYTFNILRGVMNPLYVAVLIDILGHILSFCF